MRGGQRLSDVGARAEAGIDEAARLRALQCRGVGGYPLRLHQDRLVPVKAEPAQIFEDAVDELGPAPRLVEILDPEQELPAVFARPRMPEDGAIGMAEVQPPGR